MANLNDTAIEDLTSEHNDFCVNLKAYIESTEGNEISRHVLDTLIERVCDQAEFINLRTHLLNNH